MSVVTELTIDGTGATKGAEEYSRAMNTAQDAMKRGLGAMNDNVQAHTNIFDRATSALSSYTKQIVAAGVAAVTVSAFQKLAISIADIGESARKSSLDVETFQKIVYAMSVSGISADKTKDSLVKIAKALDEAGREENDLSKFLDANNIKWKENGKVVLDTAQAFNIMADFIKKANSEHQRSQVLEKFGVSEDLMAGLTNGSEEIKRREAELVELGGVIDKNVIDKAQQFDLEWKEASAKIAVYIRAWLAESIPLVRQLVDMVETLAKADMRTFNQKLNDAAEKGQKQLQDFLSDGNIKGNIIPALNALADDIAKSDFMRNLNSSINRMLGLTTETALEAARREIREKFPQLWEFDEKDVKVDFSFVARGVNDLMKSFTEGGTSKIAEISAAINVPLDAESWIAKIANPAFVSNFQKAMTIIWTSSVPPRFAAGQMGDTIKGLDDKDDDKKKSDRWEAEIKILERHTARMMADAASVGFSSGQHEMLRAQLGLLQAAKEKDGDITAKQIAEYAKWAESLGVAGAIEKAGIDIDDAKIKKMIELSEAAKVAGDALAKARVDSDIKFGRETAFMSPDDVQIAQKLKGLYGDDIPKALASSEAQAIRLNNALKSVADIIRNGLADFTKSFVQNMMQGKNVLDSMVLSARSLSTTLASQSITEAFKGNIVGAAASGIGAIISGIFGSSQTSEEKRAMALRTQDIQLRAHGTDPNSLSDILAAFDLKAKEEVAGLKGGGFETKGGFLGFGGRQVKTSEATMLEQAQAEERLRVIQDFNQKAIDSDKAAADERLAIEKATADRKLSYDDRVFAAANDASTLAGAIAAQDRQFAREQRDEIEKGGNLLIDLVSAQQAERLALEKSFNDKQIEEDTRAAKERADALNSAARSIIDYVNGLLSGPNSTMSPTQRLTNAQASYNQLLALAQGGDVEAQAHITQEADNLLKAAREVYASGQGYQDLQTQVIAQLLALPAVTTSTDPVVQAMRDVLGAINAGNSAQALDATLQGVIKTAIDAGNAAAIGALLVPKFDTLNTTVDGGLDYNEFIQGLGPTGASLAKDGSVAGLLTDSQLRAAGIAVNGPITDAQLRAAGINVTGPITAQQLTAAGLLTDAQLRAAGVPVSGPLTDTQLRAVGIGVTGPLTESQINALGLSKEQGNILNVFRELDNNGNGVIEKAELANGYALYTASAVGTLGTLPQLTNGLNINMGNTAASTAQSAYLLDLVYQQVYQSAVSNAFLQQIFGNNGTITALFALIRTNTQHTVDNLNQSAAFHGFAGVASGGLIRGPGSGTSDSIPARLSNGEFVINARSTASNLSLLQAINDNVPISVSGGRGDNGALLAEVRRLNDRIESLERTVAASAANSAQAIVESVAEHQEATERGTKKTTSAIELAQRNQRAA